jgi:hypothetical protein
VIGIFINLIASRCNSKIIVFDRFILTTFYEVFFTPLCNPKAFVISEPPGTEGAPPPGCDTLNGAATGTCAGAMPFIISWERMN